LAPAAAVLAPPALAATKPPAHLTTALATKYIRADVTSAFGLFGGDKFVITGCHAIRGGAYTCKVELIPQQSNSRSRWTNTVKLVKGKPVVTYSKIINS
jgi:hypothetical protein